ncbi:hypothetical protein FSP39_008078 [Pinctada imbricata]|uniref:Uncharacterized protein n=1 Tax=Pinctada imbricata TaxID=66713 RepID=A0AA88Y3S5_PINIB|nr:hypothetical protein FSP39_004550 [Pinctada imbricata]KAK3097251.1 hypothetical protein FSP39_008078 [Pinctada imbricata]
MEGEGQGGFKAWKRNTGNEAQDRLSVIQRAGRRNNRNRNMKRVRNRQFLRKIERRLENGKPIFSERAMELIQQKGFNDNHFKVPQNQQKLNKAFGFCDIPQEENLLQMFPGLFRTETDILNLPEMNKKLRSSLPTNQKRWKATAALKIEVPRDIERQPEGTTDQQLIGGESNLTAAANLSPRRKPTSGFVCDCCRMPRYYQAFSNVTIDNTTYRVIDIFGKRQFFATEECPEVHSCPFGGCIQRYTMQHLLIWNDSKPFFPSFDFAPWPVPSSCEWANVGS